jgi:hypothetical protein
MGWGLQVTEPWNRGFLLAIAGRGVTIQRMPMFLFEPDRAVSLRAFGALALAVIFYLSR